MNSRVKLAVTLPLVTSSAIPDRQLQKSLLLAIAKKALSIERVNFDLKFRKMQEA